MEGPAGPASALAACYAGTVEDGERLLDPARRVATPLADALGALPYVMLQSALDEAFPSGRLYYTTSRTLDDLSEVIALIVEQWQAAPRDPVPWVVVEHMGGAVAAVPSDGTACGNRDARYEVSVWAGWTDPNRTDEYMAWGAASPGSWIGTRAPPATSATSTTPARTRCGRRTATAMRACRR